MATFVLVHPAWMGGWCWNKVAVPLRELGHVVHAPTLTGLAERAHLASPDVGLRTHAEDVASVVVFDDLRDVILVGTSSGGTVITDVASRVSDRIGSLVYLDAFLPSDGESTVDLMPPERREELEKLVETDGDGWLLPRFGPPPWPVILRGDVWRLFFPHSVPGFQHLIPAGYIKEELDPLLQLARTENNLDQSQGCFVGWPQALAAQSKENPLGCLAVRNGHRLPDYRQIDCLIIHEPPPTSPWVAGSCVPPCR